MANIDSYLQAIKDAIKGVDVRDSIHDAIEAINNENETLSTRIAAEVAETMDETIADYIENDVLTFLYNPRIYSDEYLHLSEETYQSDIMSQNKILIQWMEYSGTTLTYEGYFLCIAKKYYTTSDTNGYLYFYNPNTSKLLEVIVTNVASDIFQFNEIDISSGGGGSTTPQNFSLIFTLDSNKIVTCNRSSTEAEDFMDNKYGSGNWQWEDFWKEAVITLYNEYKAWDYSMAQVDGSPKVVMTLDHVYLDDGDVYLYFSTDYVSTDALEVDNHHTYVEFSWDLYGWTTSDDANDVECQIYGGLEAGTGIDISTAHHLPGTGIVTNVISIDLQNAEDNSF